MTITLESLAAQLTEIQAALRRLEQNHMLLEVKIGGLEAYVGRAIAGFEGRVQDHVNFGLAQVREDLAILRKAVHPKPGGRQASEMLLTSPASG